ncbi:hypothetical protein JL722_11054 [Aureococcus anophagefferens]|nr:hypothetical protein JL722_11054 [Aureococcus anophagefferens]
MFWDQEDVSDGGFDDGVDIERESAASTPSRRERGSFAARRAHASADEMLHQLRLDRAARPWACSSTSSSGSPRPSRDDELRWIRAAAAAGAAPPSAVARSTRRGRPLSATAANELLWRHVFPFGACKINPTRPLSALLTEHGDRVGASLRDGGLRGLLGLLHGDRREASCALDRLIDGLDARGPPLAPRGRTPAVLVVDDSAATRLSRSLDAFGVSARVSVEIARDGVEAVRAVHDDVARRDTCFILVLLDLRMPNLDGASRRASSAGRGRRRRSSP